MKKLQDIMRKLIISWFLGVFIFQTSAIAQTAPVNGAFGGGSGIFVYLGNSPVSENTPVDGIASYKLERKTSTGQDWISVAKITGPASESDFSQRLTVAVKSMPYEISFLLKSGTKIWAEYQKYKRIDSLKSWISYIPVQIAFGIVYYDQTVKATEVYQYRVIHSDKGGNPQKTIVYTATSFPGKNAAKGLVFLKYQAFASQVILIWNSTTLKTPAFSKVYRQNKNGGEWLPIGALINRQLKKDTAYITVVDTTVTTGAIYRYKLVPLDYYGNPGVEAVSGDVAVYNFTMQAPLVQKIEAKTSVGEPGILITWVLSRYDMANSVKVYRSEGYDKGYVQIAEVSPISNQYTDQQVVANTKYYYYLRLTGPLGELTQPSTRVFAISDDLSAPLPPRIIEASSIPEGVQLKIAVGESDLNGIRIFRLDQSKGALYPVSDLLAVKDPLITWKDTSGRLQPGQFYGYAVKTENRSNVTSVFSDTMFVRPGNNTKPSKALGLSGKFMETYIQLYWTNMQTIDPGVSGYLVYRRELPNGKETLLSDSLLDIEHNSYTDRKMEVGKSYAYSLETVDDFGNTSGKCESVVVSVPLKNVPLVTGLAGTPVDAGIRLTWNGLEYPGLKEYRVYKYLRGTKPILAGKVVPGEPLEYIDKTVLKGQLSFYYITAVSADNREGKASDEVGVRK